MHTTWVSTASGVHDNACLSKGIVVLLTNLDMNKVMPLIELRQQLRSCNDTTEAAAEPAPLAASKRAPHRRLSKQQRQEALERYHAGHYGVIHDALSNCLTSDAGV